MLVLLVLLAGYFAYAAQDFALDASSDTLVLEGDEDLRYSRVVDERYGGDAALFVTYTPPRDLLDPASLDELRRLRAELAAIPRVAAVTSLLDVPLLRNPPVPLTELQANLKTLEHPDVDFDLAREEFMNSPVYRDLIVSRDLGSTAMQVQLARDERHEELSDRLAELVKYQRQRGLTRLELEELSGLQGKYAESKERRRQEVHADITSVRGVLERFRGESQLFLGGVPMIADDIMAFIRADIVVFGIGILGLLSLTLLWVFRGLRWVVLPLACCLYSGLAMVGILGGLGWQVTVVSSNFISLQLIFTLSLAIHIIVRFQEGLRSAPDRPYREQIREAVGHTFVPCLYASLTTIAGFSSLTLCDILPVVSFGRMMTMGILVSLLATFVLFPAALMTLSPAQLRGPAGKDRLLTRFLASLTEKRGNLILLAATVIAVLNGIGMSRLRVENSFIDYFKETSEIYQGMEFIDRRLGGTTPLDVTLEFPSSVEVAVAPGAADEEFDEFDEFEDFDDFGDFDEEGDAAAETTYWFTATKLDRIRRVHDYLDDLPQTGKVMSLATLAALGREANQGEPLDDFLTAILFQEMPEDVKQVLITPYVSVPDDQARINVRIKDSMPGLERDALLKKIRHDIEHELGLTPNQFRVSGLMVLYNNMLQSLFQSQSSTIGYTIAALMAMFWLLFRSVRIAVIAILPSLLSSLVVLGVMGLGGIPLDIMTITVVAISTGIAVDDTIHYLHRFRRELAVDGDYVGAMHRCHGSIGNAMYFTTIAITLGFSILALSNFVPSILFGLLTALAMVMALVSALTLLPRLIVLVKPFGPGGTAEKLPA